jgi:ribosomal protein S18 acetylase RimI-like enzyme
VSGSQEKGEIRMTTHVREATLADLADVARIHKSRFASGRYTLGRYSIPLLRAFYAAFLGRSIFLVHTCNDKVGGFVLGGTEEAIAASKRDFIRNNLCRCALETIWHPSLWNRTIHTAYESLKPRRATVPCELEKNGISMLSLAIAEDAARTGAATALFQAFDEIARDRCSHYRLTVYRSNTSVIRYYDILGLKRVGESSDSYVYERRFRPDS